MKGMKNREGTENNEAEVTNKFFSHIIRRETTLSLASRQKIKYHSARDATTINTLAMHQYMCLCPDY